MSLFITVVTQFVLFALHLIFVYSLEVSGRFEARRTLIFTGNYSTVVAQFVSFTWRSLCQISFSFTLTAVKSPLAFRASLCAAASKAITATHW